MPLTKEERIALATRVRLGEKITVKSGKSIDECLLDVGGTPVGIIILVRPGDGLRWGDGVEYHHPDASVTACVLAYLERD